MDQAGFQRTAYGVCKCDCTSWITVILEYHAVNNSLVGLQSESHIAINVNRPLEEPGSMTPTRTKMNQNNLGSKQARNLWSAVIQRHFSNYFRFSNAVWIAFQNPCVRLTSICKAVRDTHRVHCTPRWSLFLRLVQPLLVMVAITLVDTDRFDLNAKEGEWIQIFDGKTLNGWHTNKEVIGKDTGGHWIVEDGTIAGEQDPPGSGIGGVLLTNRKFDDFEVTVDAKPDWGICSGFFVRCTEAGQAYQVMVDYHDSGNVGHVHGEHCGSFNNRPFLIDGVYDDKKKLIGMKTKLSGLVVPEAYSISGANWVTIWKINDWNTIKVRVVGNPPRITTWINDSKISQFDGTTYDGPKYDRQYVSELLGARGSLGFQVHGGSGWPKGAKCRWKNVKVLLLNDN